ncbi:MAG: hexameric tyrosine-coordinated heme protein [Paracoccaceae bacterium]
MIRQVFLPALVGLAAMSGPGFAQDESASWLPSLITETPEQGFDLAISMARKAVTTTQTDTEILHALRPNYSRDPDHLIDVSGVVGRYFATVAEANDYWRD